MPSRSIAFALLVAANARSLGPQPLFAPKVAERLQKLREEFEQRVLRRGSSGTASAQPTFAGSWKTAATEGMDEYLDRAMGVGYLKRKVACKASQQQRLWQEGSVVHLEMTDKRGTAKFVIRPDGKTYGGKGFMKLPMKQRARWEKDVLVIDEKYTQHFGGVEHGKPAAGEQCPVIRSYRSVDRSGRMVVQLERRLLTGDVVGMKTFYTRIDKKR